MRVIVKQNKIGRSVVLTRTHPLCLESRCVEVASPPNSDRAEAWHPKSAIFDVSTSKRTPASSAKGTGSYTLQTNRVSSKKSSENRQKNLELLFEKRVILSAGAMLIFSVSFQIDQMPEGDYIV